MRFKKSGKIQYVAPGKGADSEGLGDRRDLDAHLHGNLAAIQDLQFVRSNALDGTVLAHLIGTTTADFHDLRQVVIR